MYSTKEEKLTQVELPRFPSPPHILAPPTQPCYVSEPFLKLNILYDPFPYVVYYLFGMIFFILYVSSNSCKHTALLEILAKTCYSLSEFPDQ